MDNTKNTAPAKTYAERVQELENEGLTTSDAQGVADVEAARGLISDDCNDDALCRICKKFPATQKGTQPQCCHSCGEDVPF